MRIRKSFYQSPDARAICSTSIVENVHHKSLYKFSRPFFFFVLKSIWYPWFFIFTIELHWVMDRYSFIYSSLLSDWFHHWVSTKASTSLSQHCFFFFIFYSFFLKKKALTNLHVTTRNMCASFFHLTFVKLIFATSDRCAVVFLLFYLCIVFHFSMGILEWEEKLWVDGG